MTEEITKILNTGLGTVEEFYKEGVAAGAALTPYAELLAEYKALEPLEAPTLKEQILAEWRKETLFKVLTAQFAVAA